MSAVTDYKSVNIDVKNYRPSNSLGERTIYSHTVNGKRYYSSIDAEIYFGDRYIDEIVQISWNIDQATLPLYGYNSYVFDDIAVGARQITGSFMINFTKSGFMYDVLASVQSISRSSFQTADELNYKVSWSSYFEKEHMPGWDKSFNIVVGYGDYTNREGQTMVLLHCVQLTGCQQVLGADGGVIGEVYSFIAKDIRYELNRLPANNTESDSSTTEEEVTVEEKAPKIVINSAVMNWKKKAQIINSDDPLNSDLSFGAISSALLDIETFTFNMNYSIVDADNIEITGIQVMFREADGTYINTSYIDIGVGKNNEISYKLDTKYTQKLNNEIKSQQNAGVSSGNYTLRFDLMVNYSQNGSQKYMTKTNFVMGVNEL